MPQAPDHFDRPQLIVAECWRDGLIPSRRWTVRSFHPATVMPLERLGPYKLEKVLGRGGMGSVYAGVHGQTGERAAVKVLAVHLSDDVNFVERFKAEVETLKKLLHPNIVTLHGYGADDGYLFYVMELIEGRSLQDELQAGRRFSWREVARIGVDISKALKHAHDRGVIHRDLKPANLLLDPQDHTKLTDFGIAKLYGGTQITADGGVLGTADYMSPEQAEGKQVTARCDLYSLGSVLYALLVGRPPFAGKSLPEVIQGLRFEQPIQLRRLNPDVPEEFESIIHQLLEKDPQKRIPTAMAVANRLRAMEHALSVETRVGQVIEPLPDDEEELRLAPDPGQTSPGSPSTSISTANRPTAPLSSRPRNGRGDANDLTIVTGLGNQSEGKRLVPTGADAEPIPSLAPEPALPRPAHFTTVTQSELRHRDDSRDADEQTLAGWLRIGLLFVALLLVGGMIAYFATRPLSADQVYNRVKGVADEGDTQALIELEPDVQRFLEVFPDDGRAAEMRQFQEEIELYRLQRRFELRARRLGTTDALSPIERVYLDAVRLAPTDPDAALLKFQALVDVYDNSQDKEETPLQARTNQQCIDLARKQVERLIESTKRMNLQQRKMIRQQLDQAMTLAKSDPLAAEKTFRGIVELYGGRTWAQDLVQEARGQLGKSP